MMGGISVFQASQRRLNVCIVSSESNVHVGQKTLLEFCLTYDLWNTYKLLLNHIATVVVCTFQKRISRPITDA